MSTSSAKPVNNTILHYEKFSKLIYEYHLGGPNFWYKGQDVSGYVKAIHDGASKLINILLYCFFALQWGSFFTQHNLNDKQKADQAIYSFGLSAIHSFVHVLTYHKQKIHDLSYHLAIKLKEPFNDTEVEKQMVKQVKIYIAVFGFFLSSMLIMYGVNGILDVFVKDTAFVTVITAWPDVEDRSMVAGIARIVIYIFLWISVLRIYAAYVVVLMVTICLSHQYKNLCSYFYSLNDIFKKEQTQEENEKNYEEAFRLGIDLHSSTLRCTKLTQEIMDIVFSVQIVLNVTLLILLLFQMTHSERTLANTLTTVVTMGSQLISTGCFWWNAGDVSVAASDLPTAMFSSGWQHCGKEATLRIRHMLLIAMWQSQRPVQLRCLGVVDLSYSSYVTIVKSSYSIFSVLY